MALVNGPSSNARFLINFYQQLFGCIKTCVSLQIKEDTDLFIIDEVGKMELFSSSFFPAVLKVLESNIPLLASIPIPKFGRDIPAGISAEHTSQKCKYLQSLSQSVDWMFSYLL